MEIRIASENDIKQIEQLYKQLFSDMAKLQPQYWQKASPSIGHIKATIKSKTADILLAIMDFQIIGFALVEEQETLPYKCIVYHKFANLMDLIVDESHRGQGVGSALLTSVKLWAKNRRLEFVELQVLSENTDAIKLYESFKYRAVKHTMHLPLQYDVDTEELK